MFWVFSDWIAYFIPLCMLVLQCVFLRKRLLSCITIIELPASGHLTLVPCLSPAPGPDSTSACCPSHVLVAPLLWGCLCFRVGGLLGAACCVSFYLDSFPALLCLSSHWRFWGQWTGILYVFPVLVCVMFPWIGFGDTLWEIECEWHCPRVFASCLTDFWPSF